MKIQNRCLTCELVDALQRFSLSTIILASAKLISDNYQADSIGSSEKDVENCKLSLLAVSSTAPEECGDTALMQVCSSAISFSVDTINEE